MESEILNLTGAEDANIIAKYLPRRYEKKKIKHMPRFVERFREFSENV